MKVKNSCKKVGKIFGEYVLQQYFCTRNRERCGGDMMKEGLRNPERWNRGMRLEDPSECPEVVPKELPKK